MLNFSFFIAGFLSILWATFSLRFINLENLLTNGTADTLYQAVIITLFPITVIWGIVLVIRNAYKEKNTMEQVYGALQQLKKNSETATTIGHALIDVCLEIKNNAVLQKINLFISDINENLSDIIKRSNSISSAQIEHLWNRTSGGEQWLLAKTFIETYDFQPDFATHLIQKGRKDEILKESILDFCARYLNLRQLLESYDKQRLFYNLVENGPLGKVFRLMTPIADKLQTEEPIPLVTPKKNKDFSLTVDEPLEFPSFLSTEETITPSLKTETPRPNTDIDAGLKIIRDELLAPSSKEDIPPAPTISSFSNTQSALRNFKQMPSISLPQTDEIDTPKEKLISLDELEKEINASPENNYDEYAYPFGGR